MQQSWLYPSRPRAGTTVDQQQQAQAAAMLAARRLAMDTPQGQPMQNFSESNPMSPANSTSTPSSIPSTSDPSSSSHTVHQPQPQPVHPQPQPNQPSMNSNMGGARLDTGFVPPQNQIPQGASSLPSPLYPQQGFLATYQMAGQPQMVPSGVPSGQGGQPYYQPQQGVQTGTQPVSIPQHMMYQPQPSMGHLPPMQIPPNYQYLPQRVSACLVLITFSLVYMSCVLVW